MIKLYSFLALVACFTPTVLGHGWVARIIIDGTTYEGNNPFNPGSASPSPIRLPKSSDPVKGATNPDLGCGLEAKAGAKVADAKAGSKVEFHWINDAPDKPVSCNANGKCRYGVSQYLYFQWIHSIGPAITYMAKCEGAPCDKFDSKGAKWFKIDQQAQPDPKNLSHWIAGDVGEFSFFNRMRF